MAKKIFSGSPPPEQQALQQKSLVEKLMAASESTLEREFDHMTVRKRVVDSKGMFKQTFKLKDVFDNDKALLSRLKGEEYNSQESLLK